MNFQPICEIDPDGTKYWYLNDQLHREDGPAIESVNGSKFWWLDGQFHRIHGPACEWSDGRKEWWLNGKRHRDDGPALELADGTKYWYLNANQLNPRKSINDLELKNRYPELVTSMLVYLVHNS